MHFTTPLILLSSLALPYIALAEPTVPVLPPDQTIVPFATLPDCAASCGLLFDVQGACSPPQVQAASTKSCFCSDSRLTALKTSNTGVCDAAGCDATGLGQIQTWYKNLCGGTTSNTSPTTTGSTAAGTGVSAGTTNSSTAKKNGDGTWFVALSPLVTVSTLSPVPQHKLPCQTAANFQPTGSPRMYNGLLWPS